MTGYITAKEASEKWNITVRSVQYLCSSGKIEGAVRFGRTWAIPDNAEKPNDDRIKHGKYINWRNEIKGEQK